MFNKMQNSLKTTSSGKNKRVLKGADSQSGNNK